MDEKLIKDIKAVVATIFSEKEESDMRKRTEDALQKAAATIEDLTNSLEERNADMEDLQSKLSESDASVEELKTTLEAAGEEAKSLQTKLDEAETSLEDMKKDRLAEVRMAELETSGVVHNEEEARTNQKSKVREMSDEDFTSYKDELASIRQAVLDELATASTEEETTEEETASEETTEEETNEEETASEETTEEEETDESDETASEETTEEEEEGTPLANIDPNQAITAAWNLDVKPSAELSEKYAELGKALAEKIKNEKK